MTPGGLSPVAGQCRAAVHRTQGERDVFQPPKSRQPANTNPNVPTTFNSGEAD
ncbi:hypothetical protein SAMN05216174_10613 [Actinokineospora iranica]|uniref:Uncharacterized protein n=1 Tax=Actinokineospora iranica TaxID=1271860 RepID=A0A1G6QY25_9PSEU|nr:hypothetical protein SAMN05216174_10613 [Actinokineospora iranica]